jgi:ATP-dependent Clp protease ATP-binding subunit ClpC
MFEKFTDRARQAIVLSQEEARLLSHNYIGTEHLLLGLLGPLDQRGDAASSLMAAGLTAESVRKHVEGIVGVGKKQPDGHIPFTPRLKKSLEQAMRESLRLGHGSIGAEHLLLGLLRQSESVGVRVITELGADPDQIRAQVLERLSTHPPSEADTPASVTRVAGEALSSPRPLRGFAPAVPALDRFGRILDASALSPVAGREAEVARVVRVLSRQSRNNVALLGAPGSGRTAIASAVAKLIADGSAPRPLRGKKLYAVDFGLVTTGIEDRGDIERRVTMLLAEIRARREVIVLTRDLAPFTGSPVVAAFVRSALARQELRLVTTGTADAWPDDLADLFQVVQVATPTVDEAVVMLGALRPRYEEHHGVRITDAALGAAARLAPGVLPGAAADLLDSACALVSSPSAAGRDVGEDDIRRALEGSA